MMLTQDKYEKLLNECIFQSSRSQGPGGQNVNKVNSRVELRFNVKESKILELREQDQILKKLKNRISSDFILILSEQGSRSQIQNKTLLTEKFKSLIESALRKKKKRIPTRATRASKEKRLERKKNISVKKKLRRNPDVV